MSNKKKVINIEEEPIDKVEHFMAKNFRQLLGGIALILIVFIAGYTFYKMNNTKKAALADKVGSLEMVSSGDATKMNDYLKMASEYGDASDYIKLRASEVYMDKKDNKKANEVLATVGGDFKELADSLKYDMGDTKIDPKTYMTGGKLGSLWYYRACMKATGAEKTKLMAEFAKNYPNSELLKQLKRWNG